MSYFLISMLVAFGSIMLPCFIADMITDGRFKTAGISIFFSVVYGLLFGWAYWSFAIGVYGPAPFALQIILGMIIAGIISSACANDYDKGKSTVPAWLIGGGYLLYIFGVLFFAQSSLMNSAEKADLIGEVKYVTNLEEEMQPADPVHICLISPDMAWVKANDALSKIIVSGNAIPGSRYKIGRGTRQFVNGQGWYIFEVEFQGWLKWRQDKQVPGYFRVNAQDPSLEGQPVQTNKAGEEIHVKYSKSACFEYRADRYLRNHGYMNAILDDWTLEADEDWNPYYTVCILERTMGFSGYNVKGVIVFNVQTGDFKEYSLDELPEWVDRVAPLEVLDTNIGYWGLYDKAGFWHTLFYNDKSQKPTEGWFLTYDSTGTAKWFTGFTSLSSEDEALTGFTLSDANTLETIFFKASGVTETIVSQTAKSLWSNYRDYEPTELVPYNIYGLLTCVVPITYNGQFKGVSLVAIRNKDINAMGETLEKALTSYRAAVSRASSSDLRPSGGKIEVMELTGIVSEVGQSLLQGKEQIFPFMLEGANVIFQTIYTYDSPECVFLKPGITVTITFQETLEKMVTCKTFDIPDIVLSDGSHVQARYLEQREKVKAEIGRVDKKAELEKLLKSEAANNVDPEAFRKFLESQKK